MAPKATSRKSTKSPKRASKPAARGKAPAPKPPARKRVSAVPAGFHAVTPSLVCRGAAAAIEFYQKAFGAKVKSRMDGDGGVVLHAEIAIDGSIIMLGDEMPSMGATSPATLGGTTGGLMLYVKDVDRVFDRAVAAGAKSEMAPVDQFWGDRFGRLLDPFGHRWSIATHIEDVSPKEMKKRADAWAEQAAASSAAKP